MVQVRKHYQCERCGIIMTRKSTFQNHLKRKTNCAHDIRTINKVCDQQREMEKKNVEKLHIEQENVENIIIEQYNYSVNNVINNILECIKCKKTFTTNQSLLYHEKKCKGVDSLTCTICHIKFTDRYLKAYHKKKNNCHPVISQEVNVNSNNINSNNKLNLTVNIHLPKGVKINDFGKQSLQHMLNIEVLSKLCEKIYQGSWEKLIEKIFFDDDHPENHSVKYPNLKSNYGYVRKDGKFVTEDINNIVKIVTEICCDIVHKALTQSEDIKEYQKCADRFKVLKIRGKNRNKEEDEEYTTIRPKAFAYNLLSGGYTNFTETTELNEYMIDRKKGRKKDKDLDNLMQENFAYDPEDVPMATIIQSTQRNAVAALFNGTNKQKELTNEDKENNIDLLINIEALEDQ
jgi:hypothetical protein